MVAKSPVFKRGDANDDAKVDLSDAVKILGCKFLGDPCPTCRDAGDANDDGQMDLSDAVYILSFNFLGGAPPASPGHLRCGSDESDDGLPDCVYLSCGSGDDGPPSPVPGPGC